jgi:pSer/pThr/pTyr-binding forkhead associated (FHA) protein
LNNYLLDSVEILGHNLKANMKRPPVIIVQLIHISGSMKGKIQEFSEEIISIGRHTSSHVHFPADLNIVSREHAEIIREGNQFKLIDHSTNGTLVNGKRVKETYLKNGDVLEFAEGGPKVSFLTQMKEAPVEAEIPPPRPREKPLREPKKGLPEEPKKEPQYPFEEKTPVRPAVKEPIEISVQKVTVPLIIQYGPTLRSFKELPVTIGKNPRSGFMLEHPAIFDQHAQIFFSRDQYWIKDLTGQKSVRINGQPIDFQSPLKLNDEVALSPQGPFFRFLGEGRLAEVIEPVIGPHDKPEEKAHREVSEEKVQEGMLSKFKKLWKHEPH